jgi:hypothetical protein
LLHLAAYWGPRRGELIGQERPDLSVGTRLLHIRQSQTDDELAEQAARAISAFVPRRGRENASGAVRAIDGPSGGENDPHRL